MKKLILHIGRHKSGTSSLQHWLKANRLFLNKNNFHYPKAGSSNDLLAHHILAYELNRYKSLGWKITSMAEDIIKESHNYESIILSSEAFSSIKNFKRLKKFLALFRNYEVKIFCYFREGLDYLNSAYRQRIHASNATLSLFEYSKYIKSQTEFIRSWSSIGKFKMHWFDRESLVNQNIIDDFFSKIGLAAENTNFQVNPSIGGNLLIFKLVANLIKVDLDYQSLGFLAKNYSQFSRPIYIDRDDTRFKTSIDDYNQSIAMHIGMPKIKNMPVEDTLPRLESLDKDFEIFKEYFDIKDQKLFISKCKEMSHFF
jgi:hypothetical protein